MKEKNITKIQIKDIFCNDSLEQLENRYKEIQRIWNSAESEYKTFIGTIKNKMEEMVSSKKD